MFYFDTEHPARGDWENLSEDPRDRLTVYYNGDDVYINVFEERERTQEFLQRIIKRLKSEREAINEAMLLIDQYDSSEDEKIRKAGERSRRYLTGHIERNRRAAAQLWQAINEQKK